MDAILKASLPKLREKLLEALQAVLPIAAIVLVLCFTIAPVSPSILLCFLLGAAMIVVELLTGIWHGANWNFICWGLYYFVLLAVEKLFLLPHLQKGRVWPHIYTLFLVVVGWAMFVGNDTGVSFGLLFHKLFVPSGGVSPLYFLRNYGVLLVVSILCCTPLIEKIWNLLKKNAVTRCAAILALLVVSTAYVVGSTNSPFLYFNF